MPIAVEKHDMWNTDGEYCMNEALLAFLGTLCLSNSNDEGWKIRWDNPVTVFSSNADAILDNWFRGVVLKL